MRASPRHLQRPCASACAELSPLPHPARAQIWDNKSTRQGTHGLRRGKAIHIGYYDSEETAARRVLGATPAAAWRMRGVRAHGWTRHPLGCHPRRVIPSLSAPTPPHPHPLRVYDRVAIAFFKRDAPLNVGRGGGSGNCPACARRAATRGAGDRAPPEG
jgi:hypothetical protein